ncbi:MAG: hypothetical protein R2710_11460 [Acidimicrobiales bacterium]
MADYACSLQDAGFSGMLFTETSKTRMAITAAAMAAEELTHHRHRRCVLAPPWRRRPWCNWPRTPAGGSAWGSGRR